MNTMSTTRKNLIDRMIKLYGPEHPNVIWFVGLCERWKNTEYDDRLLRVTVECHEEFPAFE